MTGLYVMVAVIAIAGLFGLVRRRSDGRMHATTTGTSPAEGAAPARQDVPARAPVPDALAEADLSAPLGQRATLVQFSSAFCAPCRATRVVLADVAATVPGVAHVELDAEAHLELVRRLDVTRTPTVVLLDASGRIRNRATGAPRKADVLAALGSIV